MDTNRSDRHNAPIPGVMELCVDCRFRAGVRCTHPGMLANGGPGLRLEGATPMSVHARFKGFWWIYRTPAHSCAGRSVDD